MGDEQQEKNRRGKGAIGMLIAKLHDFREVAVDEVNQRIKDIH